MEKFYVVQTKCLDGEKEYGDIFCIKGDNIDQVNDDWALIEIQNSSEFVIINIKKAPCKVKEGDLVIIKNKKEITKCVR